MKLSEIAYQAKELKKENQKLKQEIMTLRNNRFDSAMYEKQNHFRSLLTASSEVLYFMNADWSKMIKLNSRGFLKNTEVPNPRWLNEYIHPDDQGLVMEVIKKAIKNKSVLELEHRVRQANGNWGWTLSRAVPILNSNGEIVKWFGSANDITKRKQAEDMVQELLKSSEQRYAELNAVIEAMPDAVYIGNFEGITLCNTSGLKMLGATSLKDLQERIGELGKKFNIRWPDTGQQLSENELQFTRALKGETVIEEVLATNAETGQDVYIRAADAPIIMNGEIFGAVAINSDVTDRKKTEEALRRSEENYRLLFDSMVEGYQVVEVLYDEQGKPGDLLTLDINPACSAQSGIPIERAKGRRVKELLGHIEPAWIERAHEVVSQQKTVRFEEFSAALDRWYSTVAFPLPGKNRLGVITYNVTDIRRSQQKLMENEQRLRSIFDNAAVGITETDLKDRFLDINNRLCTMLGYTREELKAKDIYEFTHPDDMPQTIEMNKRLHEGKLRMFSYEKRYVKKDGTPVWVNVTSSAILDSKDNFIKSINTIEDITERKRAEEAVRRSETILKQAGKMANLGAWEIEFKNSDDVNRNPLYWSEQVYRIFGYEPGSVKASNDLFFEHVHPADRKIVSLVLDEAIRNRGSYNLEHRIIRTDGQERTVDEHAEIIYDELGKPLRITGAVQDITERKETEKILYQALHEAEEGKNILTALMEYIPMGITIADAPDVNIRMVSQYGQDLLEKSSEEIAGIPAPEHPSKWGVYRSDGVTPGEPEELPLSRATMKGEIVKNEEWYVTRKDGTLIPILCNAAPILDKNKSIVGGVIGWQDIADLKRIQREMHHRNEELTRFIYTISHDLKSPLVTIKMFTSYLKDDFIQKSDLAQFEKHVSFVENAADKMGKLLDELLMLSTIGRKEEPRTEVLLEEIVREAVNLVAGHISQKGVKIVYSAPPVLLYGYPKRFIQLYQNLLDNAVKFMGHQSNPQIEVGSYVDTTRNNEIVMFVKDNGIGIDPKLHHKLFGLFEKLDPKSEGTGIGLALVKQIVFIHDGNIWVSSEGQGKGTTFYFTFEKTRLLKD